MAEEVERRDLERERATRYVIDTEKLPSFFPLTLHSSQLFPVPDAYVEKHPSFRLRRAQGGEVRYTIVL